VRDGFLGDGPGKSDGPWPNLPRVVARIAGASADLVGLGRTPTRICEQGWRIDRAAEGGRRGWREVQPYRYGACRPVGNGRGQDEGAGEGRDRRSHFAAYHRHRKGGRFARDRFETPAIRAIEVGSDQMSRRLHGPLEAA
jgi:hypothetical protein